ncbi:SDR family oxidoreductase [Micromonospora sp. Llam7]|uniref:SDR family NAD(P)-dependent oxidoreductase n=1 Tax=Micromonospora tarapacensis TaxID=2835305 RepID=UPI001C8292B5|nr:SDR family NAD(P)-dependent oxidoreductase [Micromonospora tarapacensis]MBX7265776.1 SDR family oxidoreductase [Micromonospora tarapacensis]
MVSGERSAAGRFAGRSVLVTGAAKGIGRAAVAGFARAGARIVAGDIDGEALRELPAVIPVAEIELVTADVSDPDGARSMVEAAVRRYGGLDVAIANAGIIPLAGILDTSVQDWNDVMAVDGRGMFLTCKYAIEQMSGAGGGAIVCVSSISGLAGQKGQAAYGPAKFVATGLVMHLAVEWAAAGIRVNGVAPGTIRTDRVQALADEPGGPEYLESIARMHPMGRFGEPDEVADAMLFLASDEAAFITGTVLPVDGGYLAQ